MRHTEKQGYPNAQITLTLHNMSFVVVLVDDIKEYLAGVIRRLTIAVPQRRNTPKTPICQS